LTDLLPGTTYRVTVIAVLGNDRSEPIETEITTSDQVYSWMRSVVRLFRV